MPGLLDMVTGGQGGGPMDYLRNRVSSWQAHPFQNIASTLAGGFGGPAAGLGAQRGFDMYNNRRFDNSAQQFQDLTRDQTNLDTNDAMNRPLNGALGEYDRNNPYGSNAGPAQTMGPQGGPQGGGPSYSGGYNSQNWNLGQMTSGNAPNQPSSFVNDILNSISTGPGQPGTQQGGLFSKGPEGRREGNTAGGFNGPMGVSQFSPGTTLFQGMDPNQMVMANGRRNLY